MRWIVRLALFSILGMALVFAFSPSASAAPLAEDETHIVQPGETISAVIQSKIRTAYGSTWNIWMPYWLGLYWAGGTENGFHGMPWNAATGRQMWPGLVGTPILMVASCSPMRTLRFSGSGLHRYAGDHRILKTKGVSSWRKTSFAGWK
jgi:hypothetical protein